MISRSACVVWLMQGMGLMIRVAATTVKNHAWWGCVFAVLDRCKWVAHGNTENDIHRHTRMLSTLTRTCGRFVDGYRGVG